MADGGKLLIVYCLREMPYAEYLQTNHWQSVREETMRRCGWRCRWCGHKAHHVHHLSYENRGCEKEEDTFALCTKHHKMMHENWIHRSHSDWDGRLL